MNQAIDNIHRPDNAHDRYKAKCEALLALDREIKEATKALMQKIEALDELELEINKGA